MKSEYGFSCLAAISFLLISPVAHAEIYTMEPDQPETEGSTYYWRPSPGDMQHPGNMIRVNLDLPKGYTPRGTHLASDSGYTLTGNVEWAFSGCGARANPCIERQYWGIPNATFDVSWRMWGETTAIERSRRRRFGQVTSDADGNFQMTAPLPNGGRRFDPATPNQLTLHVDALRYQDRAYPEGRPLSAAPNTFFVPFSKQLELRFFVDDFHVTEIRSSTNHVTPGQEIAISGKLDVEDAFAAGRSLANAIAQASYSGNVIGQFPVAADGRFSGRIAPPRLDGDYLVEVTGVLDGQQSVGRSFYLVRNDEINPNAAVKHAEAAEMYNGLDAANLTFDTNLAARRGTQAATAKNDLVALHCDMVKRVRPLLQSGVAMDTKASVLAMLAEYEDRILSGASSPREAVVSLYRDLSNDPSAQVCQYSELDLFSNENAEQSHFLAPFIETGTTNVYLGFMNRIFAKAGLSLKEPLPFGKIDLSATWMAPIGNGAQRPVSVVDFAHLQSDRTPMLIALVERGVGAFAPVSVASGAPAAAAAASARRRPSLSEDERKAVRKLYRELMAYRYFGEGVLSAGTVAELLDVQGFGSDRQAWLVGAFEELFALRLDIAPVQSGYRFTFAHFS
ncbi:hypothetical protein [Novosphingobium mangrovi (ex Hu et al. 2023)]|uniref:Uncharacterized protein n=1 Tax=Novosphingobium mangrovi (ex Hu et al. 2023) TaxID=2930094 RepID=A0ABT0AI96_9SPHN|nr:hypothetical protein [Novosphingobium mangrovi (ex Hu et al. 2023)]MCJ1962921.1 hypothetical protein [Novosphingobium mangrovi (ex Hu et al. 2023)]